MNDVKQWLTFTQPVPSRKLCFALRRFKNITSSQEHATECWNPSKYSLEIREKDFIHKL